MTTRYITRLECGCESAPEGHLPLLVPIVGSYRFCWVHRISQKVISVLEVDRVIHLTKSGKLARRIK